MSRAASRAASLALFVLASAALTALAGCAGTVRSASRAAVPVVVDESLGAFEDPRNRERLEQILASPEMQGAIEETAHALVRGVLEPGADIRAQAIAAALTDTVATTIARDLRERILPATVDGIRTSLREALSPEDRRAIRGAVDAAVAQATASAIRSASAEIPRSFAPAMRAALVESLNSPELHGAVAGITADATRSALMSSRDLIIELRDRSEGSGPIVQLVERVQRMLVRTLLAAFVAGALLGGLLIWVARHVLHGGSGRGPSGSAGRGPSGSEPSGLSGSEPSGRLASQAPSLSGERGPGRLDPTPTRAT
jgi:hypothetical protein